jgi:ANTAR domain
MNENSCRTAGATDTAGQPLPVGPELAVVRRSGQGWRVGDSELPDLTSAMVLADLLAADNPGALPGALPPLADEPGAAAEVLAVGCLSGQESIDPVAEAARLRVTVVQLEGALVRRVRVEQAIGIICERRRIPPRKAFELLRSQARASGARVSELAARVVDSATNPLLMLPAELARPPREPRARGKSPRHRRAGE